MQKSAIIAILVLASLSAATNLPYDLQGYWVVAGSWGFADQAQYYCPRATFDVDGSNNIQFYYEFSDKLNHKLITNRSWYDYDGVTNQLQDIFSSSQWTWDILYYNYTEGALVLTQASNQTGLILISNFRYDSTLLSFLTKIVTQLNLNTILTKLKVYPEENCQADNLPLAHGLISKELPGMWWYGAVFQVNQASAYDCYHVNITAYLQFQLTFQWSNGGALTLIPKPTQEALMVSTNPLGEYAGTVNYLARDKSFFIWTYTTFNFGIVLSKNATLSSDQVTEAKKHLSEAGYSLIDGYNFLIPDNSNC